MFTELLRLQTVIVRLPPGTAIPASAVNRLQAVPRRVYLVGPGGAQTLADSTAIVLPWDDGFLLPTQGNIKAALVASGSQPNGAVYVTADPTHVADAAKAHVGTVLVGERYDPEALPDFMPNDWDDAATALGSARPGRMPGYFLELKTTWPEFGSAGADGRILPNVPMADDLDGRASAMILGRYFPSGEGRHVLHQPTVRLMRLKGRGSSTGPTDPLAGVLRAALTEVHRRRPVDTVTRVPPKPDTGRDWMAELVQAAFAGPFRSRGFSLPFEQSLLTCPRRYPPQKSAGGYADRAANVRGQFTTAAEVHGRHIVVVDDILTSGSTLAECARTLLSAGASYVTALPLAKNQRLVWSDRALPCTDQACDGTFTVRINRGNYAAFWGCTRFREGCREHLSWAEGHGRLTALSIRDEIDDDRDIPF